MTTHASQFSSDSGVKATDLRHRAVIQKATNNYFTKVTETKSHFLDWNYGRELSRSTKWEAINHLDQYLEQFERATSSRGTIVHWAETSEEVHEILKQICDKYNVQKVVKSKSMITEEIHLNHFLEKEGIQVLETDLGEYIVQLRGETPYHIVTPVMHLTKEDIDQTFHEKLGTSLGSSAEQLAGTARRVLRDEYIQADMGITGANFLIADTGMISITENEGNARLCSALPRIHVAISGIEKVLPRLEDLALFLPMLAVSGTGQQLTCYNTMIGGPRQSSELDGPEEFHVILLDNGRTKLLSDAEQRESLHCIRCGACLNVCPIFRNVGGHAYGTTYQGPIGSVITPHLKGLKEWNHLSYASSLCGACTEACPVGIDLHHHLLQNRRNAVKSGYRGAIEQIVFLFLGAHHEKHFHLSISYKSVSSFSGLHQKFRDRRICFGSPLSMVKNTNSTSSCQRKFPRLVEKKRKDMSARTNILERIRTGLRTKAPAPPKLKQGTVFQNLSTSDLVVRFEKELQMLKGDFYRAVDWTGAENWVQKTIEENNFKEVTAAPHSDVVRVTSSTKATVTKTSKEYGSNLENSDLSITPCSYLIAYTGSVFLTSQSGYGRAFSVLPHAHMVVARKNQLLPNLSEAYSHLREQHKNDWPSLITIITGPSRTADIEKILVLGAHGPKKLFVLLLDF